MEPIKSIAERYWIAYYLVYAIAVGLGIWRYRPLQETGRDELYALVAVFALAAGIALLAAILLEVTGRMVLLIPDAIRKIKEQGREEGRKEVQEENRRRIAEERRRIADAIRKIKEQGREEGRKEVQEENRRRIADALRQLGEREDGSIHITLTPEALKILLGETDPAP